MSSKKNNSSSSGGHHFREENEKASRSGSNKKSAETKLRRLNVRRVLSMVMCIIFLLFGGAFIYFYRVLDSMNYQDFTQETSYTLPPTEGEKTDATQKVVTNSELLSDSKVLNVMLFGSDTRDTTGGDFGRSDTMILMSVDNRHKKIKFTSFQRDIYLNVPGYGFYKLNASYAFGGPQLAIATIESNFGINIDRYAVVDFESFKNIINTLGGIDIELDQNEIDYINYQMRHSHVDPINESPGLIHLNGQQALWYARDRGWDYAGEDFKVPGDDWDRTSRQRNLLRIILESMKSANIAQILSIISEVGPLVTTNLKKDEITVLASNSLKYLSYDNYEVSIPMQNQWKYSWSNDGQSIIEVMDWNTCRKSLAEFVYEEMVSVQQDIE